MTAIRDNAISMASIRRLITAHRGGLGGATDDQLKQLWDSLPAEVQEAYQKAAKRHDEKEPDAGSKP